MLNKEPLTSFSNNSLFWNNSSSVEGYAGTFYNQFTGYGNSGGSGEFYFNYLSDDQLPATFQNWTYINVPASNSSWSSTWDEIRRANIMIESLETMADEMDEDTKNHWLGVARLMRGWQHWDLVRKFGDCPWVDHVPDVDDPILYAERDDRDYVMDNVLEDLNFACENINDVSSQTTWSRNMANAMKSHICLWEGTFRKYRTLDVNGKAPDSDGATKFLQACVEACEQVMPDYSLCDNYQSIYNSETLSGNTEVIFYKEYAKDVFGHSLIAYTCSSTQQSGMTKDAFDSYLFLDGKTKDNTSYDNTDVGEWAVSANDGAGHINIKALLDVRDQRLAQTIDTLLCYPGATVAVNDNLSYTNSWPRVYGGNAMTASSGYTVCKYDNVSIEAIYRQVTTDNYTSAPLYWLSVIYLDFAEAKAELGTITNTDLDNSINLLKARAGLPPITTDVEDAGDNDMDVSPLIWEIRRERRCELMFDKNFRYWDLIRWHQLDKLDNTINPDIALGANLSADADYSTYSGDLSEGYIYGYSQDRIYEDKYYLYPIPSGQITLNPNLGQNPGWE